MFIDNLEYNIRLKLSNGSKDKNLPIMYWIPKLHKNPVSFRFLIASNNCSTKPLSKAFSNVFKTIYSQIENFHRKSKFLSNSTNSGYSKCWSCQKMLTSWIEKRKLNLLHHMTLVLCIPHILMINWLRGCVMLLILF